MPTNPLPRRTAVLMRTMLVAALAAAAIIISLLLAGGDSAGAASSTLTPVADAHVRSDVAGTNYGSSTGLLVDGSPMANAYLRSNVSVPAGEMATQATLRVYTTSSRST